MGNPADRKDLVIFGATGFTGERVVRVAIKKQQQDPSFTFSIAGRSIAKLREVLSRAQKLAGKFSLTRICLKIYLYKALSLFGLQRPRFGLWSVPLTFKFLFSAGLEEFEVQMLEADLKNPETIRAMCLSAKVLINCVGPVLSEVLGRSPYFIDFSSSFSTASMENRLSRRVLKLAPITLTLVVNHR
jgi:saccharopine dehydrogenase-like NADP-dependent oxidoreductase